MSADALDEFDVVYMGAGSTGDQEEARDVLAGKAKGTWVDCQAPFGNRDSEAFNRIVASGS
jgi:hypothetical protein